MYSLMDAPMTSCGCFEVIVAMTVDMQGVVLIDRDHTGMAPIGMKFSTLAGSIGGGRQTPGFMGIGKRYILSKRFIAAEGGLVRVAWMPKRLKESLADEIRRIGAEMGVPDLYDKIADETITEDAEGLMAWMAEKEHPALSMPPLIE
jgi:acetyl-CoA synthase